MLMLCSRSALQQHNSVLIYNYHSFLNQQKWQTHLLKKTIFCLLAFVFVWYVDDSNYCWKGAKTSVERLPQLGCLTNHPQSQYFKTNINLFPWIQSILGNRILLQAVMANRVLLTLAELSIYIINWKLADLDCDGLGSARWLFFKLQFTRSIVQFFTMYPSASLDQ